jgi:V/A-type H+/Na+-transporting ATPase subunit D
MAGEIVEGTKPTRMELLNIKKKKVLAEKGHKLLTEKRDALVAEFLGIIKTREQQRSELNKVLSQGFHSLIRAEMESGFDELKSIAASAPAVPEVPVTGVNIMGVTVPRIESSGVPETLPPFYSLHTTTPRLDAAVSNFRKVLKNILVVAEIEGTIERLAHEIEKTRRRVNALEYIFIPRLENTEKYIEMQLQEREREDFFRRKRMKAVTE